MDSKNYYKKNKIYILDFCNILLPNNKILNKNKKWRERRLRQS